MKAFMDKTQKFVLVKLVLALWILMNTPIVFADYIWIERIGSYANIHYGEINHPEDINHIQNLKVFSDKEPSLRIEPQQKFARVKLKNKYQDLYVTGFRVDEKGAAHCYYARYGNNSMKVNSELEFMPLKTKGQIFQLLWKGERIPIEQVTVNTLEGWKRVFHGNKEGMLHLETPYPSLYVIDISGEMKSSQVIEGTLYSKVIQQSSLSLKIGKLKSHKSLTHSVKKRSVPAKITKIVYR